MIFKNHFFRYILSNRFTGLEDLLKLLKSIFGAIDKITDEEKAKSMLTKEMAFKLDHVAIGYSCEYPSDFKESLESIYKSFRLKYGLEFKPRKQRDN